MAFEWDMKEVEVASASSTDSLLLATAPPFTLVCPDLLPSPSHTHRHHYEQYSSCPNNRRWLSHQSRPWKSKTWSGWFLSETTLLDFSLCSSLVFPLYDGLYWSHKARLTPMTHATLITSVLRSYLQVQSHPKVLIGECGGRTLRWNLWVLPITFCRFGTKIPFLLQSHQSSFPLGYSPVASPALLSSLYPHSYVIIGQWSHLCGAFRFHFPLRLVDHLLHEFHSHFNFCPQHRQEAWKLPNFPKGTLDFFRDDHHVLLV